MIEFIFFAAYNLFERIYWHFKYGQKDNFVLMTSIDTNRKVIVLNINWHQTGGVEWSCTKPVTSKNPGCNYLWGPEKLLGARCRSSYPQEKFLSEVLLPSLLPQQVMTNYSFSKNKNNMSILSNGKQAKTTSRQKQANGKEH